MALLAVLNDTTQVLNDPTEIQNEAPSLMIVHLMAPQVLKYQAHMAFVKDLEALVKWTSEFQNPLIHIQIYSSTIFFLYVKHSWIFGYLSNWEMIMASKVRPKKIWSSGILTCLCGRLVSVIHLPTLVLTCLWTSANESPEHTNDC